MSVPSLQPFFTQRGWQPFDFQKETWDAYLAGKSDKGQIAIWGGAKMPLSSELSHAVAWRLKGNGPPSPEMDAVAPILAIQKSWSRLPDDESLLVEESLRFNLSSENLLDDLVACMNTAELARRQFREIARVSGLILQTPPGQKDRSQRELQSSASLLYEVLHRYDSENLLLLQSEPGAGR